MYRRCLLLIILISVKLVCSWPTSAHNAQLRSRVKAVSQYDPLPSSVLRVALPGNRTVLLVGCLHGSNSAVVDVLETIATSRPRAVVLELCHSRYKILQRNEANDFNADVTQATNRWPEWKSLVQAAFESGGPAQGAIAGLLALSLVFQPLSFKRGAEFNAAIRAVRSLARETPCDLILGDMDYEATMRRAASRKALFGDVRRLVPTLGKALGFAPPRQAELPAMNVLQVLTSPDSKVTLDAAQSLFRYMPILFGLTIPLAAAGSLGNHEVVGLLSLLRTIFDILFAGFGILLVSKLVETVLVERNLVLANATLRTAAIVPDGSYIVVVLGLLHVNGVASELELRSLQNT